MRISVAGLNLIKKDEGFKPRLYNRPVNDASMGYGHLVHHGPICGAASEAPILVGISEEQRTELLLQDVAYAEHAVEHLVRCLCHRDSTTRLCLFTYNEGAGRLQTSRLLKVL